MPKVVDHEARRRELAEAVWRVIRRDGVEAASVRAVAAEAGWSAGALRHYFQTQSDLLAFAMRLVVERVRARVLAAGRERPEQVLQELLPLDPERRAENEVWLAFTARALVDPALRALHAEVHDAQRATCEWAVGAQDAPAVHALIDGLAVHTALHPGEPPLDVLERHLARLRAVSRAGASASAAGRAGSRAR